MSNFRSVNILKRILSKEQAEGAGARVRRSIGNSEFRNFDPFLMVRNFSSHDSCNVEYNTHHPFLSLSYLQFSLTSLRSWLLVVSPTTLTVVSRLAHTSCLLPMASSPTVTSRDTKAPSPLVTFST